MANPNQSHAHRMVSAIGHYGYWGNSGTFDFMEAILSSKEQDVTSDELKVEREQDASSLEPLRVLLVHPGDIRHILTTLAHRRRHKAGTGRLGDSELRPIEFYLLEMPIEVLARDILLMEILFDFEVPIRQRAGVFLEVFGNTMVQERTAKYVERLGYELRDLVGNNEGRQEGFMDLSLLKYRERDQLEEAFKR